MFFIAVTKEIGYTRLDYPMKLATYFGIHAAS